MPKIKINYKAGTCFAVPLDDGGFAYGIVARLNGKGIVLGYFFAPRVSGVEKSIDIAGFSANDAVFICRFGDLGLIKNEWIIINELPDWNPAEWPIPPFFKLDAVDPTQAYLEYYDDNLARLREEKVSPELKDKYPRDGLYGYGAVEKALNHILPKT